jgi:hypothetical protein
VLRPCFGRAYPAASVFNPSADFAAVNYPPPNFGRSGSDPPVRRMALAFFPPIVKNRAGGEEIALVGTIKES